MPTNKSYEMIEGQTQVTAPPSEGGTEGSALLPSGETTRMRRWIATVAGTAVAVAFVVALVSSPRSYTDADGRGSNSSENTAAAQPMQASENAAVAPCGLTSCTASGCDWTSAPFLCLAGGSTGGCAATVSAWSSENSNCDSFCDLSHCADVLQKAGSGAEGAEDLPRRCGDCDEEQCGVLAAHPSQACGSAAPFVCLSGAAAWGCADSELAWASAPSTTCGECCDVGGCQNA